MIAPSNIRPTVWRFQFRLRSLFGLVTVTAMALGLAGYADYRLSEEARMVRELKSIAESVNERRATTSDCGSFPRDGVWDTSSPRRIAEWHLTHIRPEYVSVTRLTVFGERPSAKAAHELERFPQLSQLTLQQNSLRDADLRPLSRLRWLQKLDVSSTHLDGSFIRHLQGNAQLDELFVDSPLVCDDGFAAICELSGLKALGVGSFRLDRPETLSRINRLNDLESLYLDGEFDPTRLAVLRTLHNLRSLTLVCPARGLNDAAFAEICQCAALENLKVSNLRLSELAALGQLKQLQHLFSLELEGEFAGDGLESLAELEELDMVTIASPRLNDKDLQRLRGSPAITYLSVASENVDNGCTETLATMPMLKEITFEHTNVTREGVARLKALRPEMEVDLIR